MAEKENAELTSPHEYIKTTATYRATLIENDLKTSRTISSTIKAMKKEPHGVWYEERMHTSSERPRRGGGITVSRILLKEQAVQAPY